MQRVGDLLRRFLAGKLSAEEERTAGLVAACREVLGDAGKHTQVRDIRGHTLVLEADHPGWAQLVLMRKAEILRRLEELVPGSGLQELRVVVGSGASGGTARRPRPEPSSAPTPEMEQALERVGDEELRQSLRELWSRARGTDPREGGRIDTGKEPGV